MEADVESASKPDTPATPAAPKQPEKKEVKKVEKKLVKKVEPEPADFKIETTTATPQMMKALLGDNSPDEPEPVEAPAPPKVAATPKVEAPKVMQINASAPTLIRKEEKKAGL